METSDMNGVAEKRKALYDEIHNGIKNMMTSDSFKAYLNTRAHLFSRKYSSNNAISIYLSKPDATYVMGYEQWIRVGRTPLPKTGIPILAPTLYYEKDNGELFSRIKSNLTTQLKTNDTAVYRVGQSALELTMIKGSNSMGMRYNGKEVGFLDTDKQQREFIDRNILNKVPAYYTVAYVFDVSDTIIKDKIYVNKEDAKKEDMVLDKNGNPIKGTGAFSKKYLVYNTTERQERFKPELDLSVTEIEPQKIKILADALINVSNKNGIPVSIVDRKDDETLASGADGYYHRPDGKSPKGYIIMPKDLHEEKPTQFVSTLMHEMAHSDLHGDIEKLAKEMGEKSITRDMREVQAEATAYLVAKKFGIETSTSSFGYLAAWSKGFELQTFEKSLNVIESAAQKIINELSAELKERGLTIDLQDVPSEPLTEEQIKNVATDYVKKSLEVQRDVTVKLGSIPALLKNFDNNTLLLPLVYDAKNNLDLQMHCTDKQIERVQELETSKDRNEQERIIVECDKSVERLNSYRSSFDDKIVALSNVEMHKNGLKEKFVANPQKTIKAMSRKSASLSNLSEDQIAYISKSTYIREKFAEQLNSEPAKFIENAVKRANDVQTIIAKNGSFVEVNSCEKWNGGKIFSGGEMMHPKVADNIIKEAEIQIRSLKSKSETYVPYIRCELNVFTKSEKNQTLMAYACKLYIGDGQQTSLSDYLHKAASNKLDVMMEFDNALREKNTRDKIIDEKQQDNIKNSKKEKSLGRE